MRNSFGTWLLEHLDAAKLTQAELASLIGVQQSQVSRMISGERGTTPEVLRSIARALRIAPEEVMRAAGYLPPKPAYDRLTEEAMDILGQLDEENREEALRYLHLRLEVQERKGKRHAPGKRKVPAAP